MSEINAELVALADHLKDRREAILRSWRLAIQRDPALTTSDALPRADLYDHIPALLATLERELYRASAGQAVSADAAATTSAAAHGLQRWQQGYDLREVTRELGKLNESVVSELESYTRSNPKISHDAVATARRLWAELCSTGIEESVGKYFELQQQEAVGHVRDLEGALAEIRELEAQRADLWQQAAHDLRGNLGVVANVTVGLSNSGLRESSRDQFVRILMRNVTSLHHLLDDVTSLARLQAGREARRVEPLDVTPVIQQLCEGILPLAEQRNLYLRCEGPPGFGVDGDSVKIRRIAQNLILNAVKYTPEGGVTVTWGDSHVDDPKRWALSIKDTGPGFHTASGNPMAQALEKGHHESVAAPDAAQEAAAQAIKAPALAARQSMESGAQMAGRHQEGGEGIGLSIVKRLCDMLDATIEVTSEQNIGTTFRILFPRSYAL
jgi:signal transduction histidine kinase